MSKENIIVKKPEVTIITLTHNRAALLARAIKSVLSQTYKSFEYIVVDQASNDNTREVVNSFQDKRIIYIQQDFNKSLALSYDDAVQISSGKYITFLDDDDEYLPTKIEKQINLIKTLPDEFGLVYCWMDYYDDKRNKLVREHHPSNKGYIYYDCIEKQSIGGTPTLFIRRDVYFEVKGFNKNLQYFSDWAFNTRIARKYLVDFVPEVLVKVHTNHSFNRLSRSKSKLDDLEKIHNLIDFHNSFLNEFSDGFEQYPIKKSGQLKSLAKLYAQLGLAKKSFIKIKEMNKLKIKKYIIINLSLQCSIFLFKAHFKNMFIFNNKYLKKVMSFSNKIYIK